MQKVLPGAVVGPARVRAVDVGRKEFQEAKRGALAGCCDQRGRDMRPVAGDGRGSVNAGGELVGHHGRSTCFAPCLSFTPAMS